MAGKNPVKITDTILRDAHQSLLATRMKTEHMLPIAEKLNEVGYYSVEMWGGATFDSCIRFLKEDPWERIRKLKEAMPDTRMQMLLRGQNIVGYRHYPDDVVERFVELAAENGIDVFRVFDALNDVRNLETAMNAVKDNNAHLQATICYTTSPVHDVDYYVDKAHELVAHDADSICIKDMAGLLDPTTSYELVTRLKDEIDIPIQLHCHYTSGMASMAYYAAIKAGVDVVDTAISSLSMGTSQPPTETLVAALKGTPWDTGFDLELLSEISDYFLDVRKEYAEFESDFTAVDTRVLQFQIPGGMISNLANQLREQGALDRMREVTEEVPRVRKDLGYPPLVTPSSQIVGTQAVLNVLLGERYKTFPNEVREYLKGMYGRPDGEINEEVRRMAIGDEEPIDCRPADLIDPEMEDLRQELIEEKDIAKDDEDVLCYALFPQVAEDFLKHKYGKAEPEPEAEAAQSTSATGETQLSDDAREYRLNINGNRYTVRLEEQ